MRLLWKTSRSPDGTHYFLASLGDKLHLSFAQWLSGWKRGDEGKEMHPKEQPKRDIPTDSLSELISSAYDRILRIC